jgi:hypothetical protein
VSTPSLPVAGGISRAVIGMRISTCSVKDMIVKEE